MIASPGSGGAHERTRRSQAQSGRDQLGSEPTPRSVGGTTRSRAGDGSTKSTPGGAPTTSPTVGGSTTSRPGGAPTTSPTVGGSTTSRPGGGSTTSRAGGILAPLVAVTIVGVALAGCDPVTPRPPASTAADTASATASTRHRDGGIRTDTAALTARFPGLGPIASASWVTGRKGDDRVPGPSGYYLDALASLDPATMAGLTTRPAPSPRPLSHILDPDLAALAPAGTLVWPLTLETRVMDTSPSYAVSLLLIEGTSTAVLTATSDRPFVTTTSTPTSG